jgi:hypothetical protein
MGWQAWKPEGWDAWKLKGKYSFPVECASLSSNKNSTGQAQLIV